MRNNAQYISGGTTVDPSLDTNVKGSYFQSKLLRTGSLLTTEESGSV